ncbi:MAG TPA: bifunctional precorrin-2 dehydrogenase/sirohydrochlorin ferrochelatase [Terriglobales bacterium]|nr:bifunctional precorrin-2 dehydrogenase/sirohydrochlorin ferrochelatase [Terriglobales bacterium]
MELFPMFMKLTGRWCLVVGGGKVAEPKIQSLLQAGATVRVIALDVNERVSQWAREGSIVCELRAFRPGDLEGQFLVIAATDSDEVNHRIYAEARRREVLCNNVDDPEHCDFYYPAVVRRGRLQIAISTGGESPALAQRLRAELEEQYGEEYAGWVSELGETRRKLLAADLDPEQRRRRLHLLASRESFKRSIGSGAQPGKRKVRR